MRAFGKVALLFFLSGLLLGATIGAGIRLCQFIVEFK